VVDGIAVREARPEELAIAARHYLGMRREIGWADGALVPDWETRFVELHRRTIAAGEARYLFAEADGRIVGSALAFLRRSPSDEFVRGAPRGFLANVYVDEAWRRRGVARALTSAAIEWLRSLNCATVRLYASARPALVRVVRIRAGQRDDAAPAAGCGRIRMKTGADAARSARRLWGILRAGSVRLIRQRHCMLAAAHIRRPGFRHLHAGPVDRHLLIAQPPDMTQIEIGLHLCAVAHIGPSTARTRKRPAGGLAGCRRSHRRSS
jgi:GNAT superfamily N-acetyltransferase